MKALGQLFVLLLMAPPTAGAAVVEIFQGDSFEAAVEALNPGDTLIVHAGTYSESGRISLSVRGTQSQPVLVRGAAGEARPLITRPVDSTPQNIINVEGATYVTISGLEFTGNGDGINLSGQPHHVTLEDNVIHDVDVGVNFRSSMDSIVVRRNQVYHTNGTGEGMYVGCNSATCAVTNSIIERNWVHDTGGDQGDGIEIKYGSWGNVIRDNVVHNTNYPCILAYGVQDQDADHPNVIEGNVVWNCGQSIDVMSDAVVRNNIVIGSLETQSHAQVPVQRNVTIVNNTVIGSMALRGWGGSNLTSTLTVANNVVYGGSLGSRLAAAVYSANQEFATDVPGVFVDAGGWDFWPAAGSPLIDAADPAYAPPTDFNGNDRRAPFDVGAYETDGLASNPGWHIVAGFKEPGQIAGDVPKPPVIRD